MNSGGSVRRRLLMLMAAALMTTAAALVAQAPAQAATSPTISGTVTNQQGERLSGIEIDMQRYFPDRKQWYTVAHPTTNAQGQYSHAVKAGKYRLFAHPVWTSVYAPRWYPNGGWPGSATSMTVTRYSIPRRNFVMPVGATISGTIGPIRASTEVEAVSHPSSVIAEADEIPHFAYTDAAGHYTITGLPAGTHRVKVHLRDLEQDPDDTPQFWFGQSAYYEKSTPVSTPLGKTITGIDIDAPVAKQVGGRVQLPSRVSPRRVNVFVWDRYGNQVLQVNTELDGRWHTILAPGYYKLEYDVEYGEGYQGGWHGGTSFATADSVVVSPTATSVTVNDSLRF